MDIHQILKQLPHRYPILLVDRVLEIEKGKSIKALKNVTINEPFFNGHFPGNPIMPGVLIIEAMAQASGVLAFVSNPVESEERLGQLLVASDQNKACLPGNHCGNWPLRCRC